MNMQTVYKNDYYFSTRKLADAWAIENNWPTQFIREFTKGYAVQACDSGRYAGTLQEAWPGSSWINPAISYDL